MNENRTITSVPGVRLAHITDRDAVTGTTVLLFPDYGAIGGVEVRGAAPGTRETDLLRPGTLVERVHSIFLTGGSAFGMNVAEGIMRHLEVEGIGFPTPGGVVPIVPGAVIYDLGIGGTDRRVTRDFGLDGAREASDAPVESGSIGAGTGATVAKTLGQDRALKGGVGTAAMDLASGHRIGAVMVVNAFGDIVDPETGVLIAGPRNDRADGPPFLSTREILRSRDRGGPGGRFGQQPTNTTIGVVATDAPLSVAQANRLAMMAHSGIARAIVPSYGMGDGDTLFFVSTAPPDATPVDTFGLTPIGAAAAEVVERAIIDSIRSATGIAGVPSAAEHISGMNGHLRQ